MHKKDFKNAINGLVASRPDNCNRMSAQYCTMKIQKQLENVVAVPTGTYYLK